MKNAFSFFGVFLDTLRVPIAVASRFWTLDGIRASIGKRFFFVSTCGYPLNKGCGNKLQTAVSDVSRRVSGIHGCDNFLRIGHEKAAREISRTAWDTLMSR